MKPVSYEARKKEIKFRKNFFPTLLIIITLWIMLTSVFYFVDPESFGAIPLFFLLTFFALFFITSTLFANTKRGMVISLAIIFFLMLRYLGVGNIVNFLLIFGLVIVFEIFFLKK